MENFSEIITINNLNLFNIVLNLLCSIFLGFLISYTYNFTHRGLAYSETFSKSLFLMCLLTAVIIMIVGNSLPRAFALVGAFSIVRFRTVVREVYDLVYIFASLAFGLSAGTGNFLIASISIIFFITLIFYLSNSKNFKFIKNSSFIVKYLLTEENIDQKNKQIYNDLKKNVSKIEFVECKSMGNYNVEYYYLIDLKSNDQIEKIHLILKNEINEIQNYSILNPKL